MIRIVLLALLLVASPVYAKTFKLATISPDGLAWMKMLRQGTKEITAKTDGRVKFKIYPGGVQGDDTTVLRKMRIGELQGGVVASSSLTRFYLDLQIYNLPFTFRNFHEVDFVRKHMDDRIIKGLDKGGIVAFHLTETGFAYLMSTKPVTTLEELRGMKVWVPTGDQVSAQLIQDFGISPIPLSLGDVLAGLQTGLIDAVIVPPIVALALQWHNQVKYMLDVPILYADSAAMLDKRAFDKLSPADQAEVETVMNRIFAKVDKDNRKDNEAAYKALINQGIKLTKPRPSQLAEWRARGQHAIGRLVKTGQLSQQSLDLLNKYLAEARQTEKNTTLAGD